MFTEHWLFLTTMFFVIEICLHCNDVAGEEKNISAKEVGTVMAKLGIHCSKEELNDMIDVVDKVFFLVWFLLLLLLLLVLHALKVLCT